MRCLVSCLLVPSFFASTFIAAAAAQTPSKSCPAPPAILTSTQPNIFSEQQEQWLGDAMADQTEIYYKPVHDPAENAYLDHIAKRLLAALPPTTIQFRVILVDSPEINGFSLAGGRVYLTRKLVANANSEDEVASVIGHEMGHILSHQFAIETTADLKRLLNITSVSDKADIYAKFQRLIDARMKDKHPGPSGDSDEKQDEADIVAVYATAAAGYQPQAYADFWNRMFFVEGKVGGPLSDFFRVTKPEQKRLRAILKLVNALPPGCGAQNPTASADFEKWRALVVANRAVSVGLDFRPVAEVSLSPPLRMDLERLRFSRDGKYILAQDESSIFVLSRDPFRQLFRFDAEKALPAEFSPDSQSIVFHTAALHTEEWSIASQKMLSSHEPISRHECIQTKLSPDGRTLVCVSFREDDMQIDLNLLDSATGAVLYQKRGFFQPNFGFLVAIAASHISSQPSDTMLASFSVDGNTLLIGPGSLKLAFDLRTRSPLALGGALKNTVNGAYTFLGSDRVVGVSLDNPKDSGIFSFPEGKHVQTVPIRLDDIESVTSGNYVLTQSIKDFAVGVVDLAAGRFVAASKTPSLDLWNGWLINENPDGGILLRKLGDDVAPHQSARLALSPLGPNLRAVTSADGHLLALSTRTRSGVYDLNTGKLLLLSRQFNSAVFAPDNTLYVENPKIEKQDRAIWHESLAPLSATLATYKEDDNTYLNYGMLQEWKPIKNKKSVELIVHDIRDNSILWQRTFDAGEPAHAPNINPGATLLSFPFKTDFAKSRLKTDTTLATEAAPIKDKDAGRLVQMLDNSTGNVLHEVALQVPPSYEGVEGINVVGSLLYLTSEDNRTMVYNLTTGEQLRQLFGSLIAADPASSRICINNRSGEAVVYDAQGHQLDDFHMGSPLRFASFQQAGNRLTILTADQKSVLWRLPLTKVAQRPCQPPDSLILFIPQSIATADELCSILYNGSRDQIQSQGPAPSAGPYPLTTEAAHY